MNPTQHRIWRKSRYSNYQDNCVEWAVPAGGGIVVRDSKDPNKPGMSLTLSQWRTFLSHVHEADVVDTGCLWISTEEAVVRARHGPVVAVWHLRQRASGAVLRFTAGERDAFLREVREHGPERTLAA